MRAAIKFTWNDHLPNDEEVGADPATRYSAEFGEQWNYQATHPVAKAVRDSIARLAGVTDLSEIYIGEHAWCFDATVGAHKYRVFVFWASDADGQHAFCVQPLLRRGCLASLFLAPQPDSLLDPAREELS